MTDFHGQARDSGWLLWLIAAAVSGLTIWAACTDFGALSYRTCAAAPARSEVPAPLARTAALAAALPSTSSGAGAAGGQRACSG